MESEVVAVSEYVPYKIHRINIFLGQGYDTQKRFCSNTMKAQLRWRRTAEIHEQVIQGKFPSDIVLLNIVLIRRILILITETHRRCLPTSALNH